MKYEIVVNHKSDLLTQDLVLTGIYKYTKFKKFGLSFDFPYIRYEHDTGDVLWPTIHLQELSNTLLPLNRYKALIKELEKKLKSYRKYIKRFEKDVSSNKNLPERINTYFNKSFLMTASIPYFLFELAIHKELDRLKIPTYLIKSSATETTKAFVELEKLAKKHKSKRLSSALYKDLQSFCKRFGYLGMKYFKGHPWTIQEAHKMLSDIDLKKKTINKEKSIENPYLEIAQKLLRLRTQKWETMCYGTHLFRKLILKHFEDEIHYEDLLNLRISEVLNIINHTYSKINPKKDSFVLEITKSGVILKTKKAKVNKSDLKEKSIIKGLCAQTGKTKGKVKIVLNPEETTKIKKGDILVTTMSTPDFLSAMIKASAFITDIGGITSHAAIISREMNKPCIIGTKIATKVLKDGDLVEVDAEKGIVRILKRN